jgi:cysteinyl-tRNA synthetase
MSGSKMAKSTGNIARVGEILETGVDPRALRYALIAVHYRASLNYTLESLAAAAAAVDRLDALLAALAAYREDRADDADLPGVLDDARIAFEAALDDDLNVSAALAVVFDLVRELNRRIDGRLLSTADAARAVGFLRELDAVFAVLADPDDEVEPELRDLLDARAAARAGQDWTASDRLRDELLARGIAVEDTRDGQRWRRVVEAGRG